MHLYDRRGLATTLTALAGIALGLTACASDSLAPQASLASHPSRTAATSASANRRATCLPPCPPGVVCAAVCTYYPPDGDGPLTIAGPAMRGH
jgi:hypothetical protein